MAETKPSPQGMVTSGEARLERSMTLLGGIALVAGAIIGMGIYALIAGIGAYAGNATWLAFTLAMVISMLGITPLIHVASAIPRAGAGYIYTSRLLNPLVGTVASYWAILGGACTTVFVSLGLAGYIAAHLPWNIPIQVLAIILPALFFVLYLFRLRLATWVQILFVAQLITALLIYGIVGSLSNPLHFSLSSPQGAGGLIMATVLCYSAWIGFQVIGETGEEMKNSRRNIPLALTIGGLVVLVIYILVGTTFIGSVPYDFEAIKCMTAPLLDTGASFLPRFWVIFLGIGALSAGLTSFNAAAIALPRELYAQARDGIAPMFIGKVNERTRSPLNAVGIYFMFVIFLLSIGLDINFYAVMAAVGILMMTVTVSIAAIKLPSKFPDRYDKAYFKLSKPWLTTASILSVLSCSLFIFLVLSEAPVVGLAYIGWTALVVVYHLLRTRWLESQGFNLKDRIRQIPGFDED
ncbi:MAG TPA: APC family permease [Dehalococcoidia bacterium]|nr:APC family permease [Dehalococcoidia bacterium]